MKRLLTCAALLAAVIVAPAQAQNLDQLLDQVKAGACLLYTSPSPRDLSTYRMPSSA